MKKKFVAKLWEVYRGDEYKINILGNMYFDNLVDLLLWLRKKNIQLECLNSCPDYEFDKFSGEEMKRYANVYHMDKMLKFSDIGKYHPVWPNYTACGYVIPQKTKSKRKIKHVYRNVKHRTNNEKEYSRCVSEMKEVMNNCSYDVSARDVNTIKMSCRKGSPRGYDYYEIVRSRNTRSWKRLKKKKQWM